MKKDPITESRDMLDRQYLQMVRNFAPKLVWAMILTALYGIDAALLYLAKPAFYPFVGICKRVLHYICPKIFMGIFDGFSHTLDPCKEKEDDIWHYATQNTTKETTMDNNEGNQLQEAQKKFMERFGSQETYVLHQITMLSMTGQPCDITFHNRKPAVGVTVDQSINLALVYGASAETLKQKFDNIKLSNGDIVGSGSIWTINPMPKGGFSDAELDAVNMSEAEERVGPNGETLREMIRNTYHCESQEEEDRFLRRFIAS